MLEFLKPMGFLEYKSCGCGGTKNIYFKNKDYDLDINVRPNKGVFQITFMNRIYKGNIQDLENNLTTILKIA